MNSKIDKILQKRIDEEKDNDEFAQIKANQMINL